MYKPNFSVNLPKQSRKNRVWCSATTLKPLSHCISPIFRFEQMNFYKYFYTFRNFYISFVHYWNSHNLSLEETLIKFEGDITQRWTYLADRVLDLRLSEIFSKGEVQGSNLVSYMLQPDHDIHVDKFYSILQLSIEWAYTYETFDCGTVLPNGLHWVLVSKVLFKRSRYTRKQSFYWTTHKHWQSIERSWRR